MRELSADVRAAVALGAGGELLAGPEALAAPARALAEALGHGAVRLAGEGLAVVARGPQVTVVVAAGRHALPGPHLLDAAVAADAPEPPRVLADPPEPLRNAARKVIAAT